MSIEKLTAARGCSASLFLALADNRDQRLVSVIENGMLASRNVENVWC
jgi:hypothetical protein